MDADKANSPADVDAAVSKILARIKAEPSYRNILHRLLAFCVTPCSAGQMREKLLSFPEMATALHSPEAVAAWMIADGGIEAISPDEEDTLWQTTEAGRKVVEQHGASARLMQLLANEPHYLEIYKQVLAFCQTPRTMGEIDHLLQDNPALENPKVYASYFIDRLEAAGGLEWEGKWRTSEAAKPFIV